MRNGNANIYLSPDLLQPDFLSQASPLDVTSFSRYIKNPKLRSEGSDANEKHMHGTKREIRTRGVWETQGNTGIKRCTLRLASSVTLNASLILLWDRAPSENCRFRANYDDFAQLPMGVLARYKTQTLKCDVPLRKI